MAKVIVKDNDLETALRKFKKQVIKEELIYECRRREFFLKKSLKRKEKSKHARIKARKK